KDHPMLDVHNTPAAVRFHDLRREQLRQRQPARFGPRACGLVPLRLPPTAQVAQQRWAVILEAIGQTEGDPAWVEYPDTVMHTLLGHLHSTSSNSDHQPQ